MDDPAADQRLHRPAPRTRRSPAASSSSSCSRTTRQLANDNGEPCIADPARRRPLFYLVITIPLGLPRRPAREDGGGCAMSDVRALRRPGPAGAAARPLILSIVAAAVLILGSSSGSCVSSPRRAARRRHQRCRACSTAARWNIFADPQVWELIGEGILAHPAAAAVAAVVRRSCSASCSSLVPQLPDRAGCASRPRGCIEFFRGMPVLLMMLLHPARRRRPAPSGPWSIALIALQRRADRRGPPRRPRVAAARAARGRPEPRPAPSSSPRC